MTVRSRLLAAVCVLALAAAACQKAEPPKPEISGDITKGNPTAAEVAAVEPEADAPTPTELSPERAARLDAELAAIPAECGVLTTEQCLLPFPSDFYTVQDRTTGTGKRVNLPPGLLPNVDGVTFDPSEWNRNDGWSPNTPILVEVPNFDPAATNLPSQANIELSTQPESATVIVDLTSGQLVPHWAEMDQRAPNASQQLLILRPASSLIETHQFAVGLRRMIGTNGVPLPASMPFQVFRDNNKVDNPRITVRQEAANFMFTKMAAAGVDRSNLYLAWEFTVAGPDTLAGRLLSMRGDAMGRLNGGSPKFQITGRSREGLSDGIDRQISGTFEVPLYLDNGGAPGARMVYSPLNGDPLAVGTYTASFRCIIPRTAAAKGEALPVVYGHGLLGGNDEVLAGDVQKTAAALNAVYCATNWIGLAEEDVPTALSVLTDLSKFPTIPDRLQQSILNTLYLARLMVDENGLGSSPDFQVDTANMMNTDQAFFDGNSQGAIMGAAATAVAQDWTKAALGVGGMNYSTLLNRSTDFSEYFAAMEQAYPNPVDQQIWFGLIQMLWDRGEAGGYVQHLIGRTYDRTPAHDVLMQVAFGDHQVANITADNMARTLKIPVYQPALPPTVPPYANQLAGVNALQGDAQTTRVAQLQSLAQYKLEPIRKFPATGSALVYWDFGTLPPPQGNITPTMSPQYEEACTGANAGQAATNPACIDPHGLVREQDRAIAQKKAFFATPGEIVNVCNFEPCVGRERKN